MSVTAMFDCWLERCFVLIPALKTGIVPVENFYGPASLPITNFPFTLLFWVKLPLTRADLFHPNLFKNRRLKINHHFFQKNLPFYPTLFTSQGVYLLNSHKGIIFKPYNQKQMKKLLLQTATFFLAALFVLSACKKTPDVVTPPPVKPGPGQSFQFQLVFDALPGMANQPVANLFVRFDVINEQNETVLSNKKLAVQFDGQFKAEAVQLPAGSYKINKLIVESGTGTVLYATPMAQSAKAAAVTKPLTYNFTLPQTNVKTIAAEVLKINTGDKATDFGYAADAFGSQTPGDGNAVSIRIKTIVTVGAIDYDYITSSLTYRYWDANQQMGMRIISLAAGENTVPLNAAAVKHEFIVSKWGEDYKLELKSNEIKADSLYIFGGKKQAKKLASELVYRLEPTGYKAESKNNYMYNERQQLLRIESYAKRPQTGQPYLATVDMFEYQNGKVSLIKRFDEHNVQTGSTTFAYDAAGRVRTVKELNAGVETTADAAYIETPGEGITEMGAQYSYSHTSLRMTHIQHFIRGNAASSQTSTSNGSYEAFINMHDAQINPYAHMGWPNLFFSNLSKNNIINQSGTYSGNYPIVTVYSYEYKYDREGYPTELIKKYRTYLTGEHAFTTKTVFSYQ